MTLQTRTDHVTRAAAEASARSEADTEPHHGDLRHADPRVRRAAISLIGDASSPEVGDALASALADTDLLAARTAARVLSELPDVQLSEDGISALVVAAGQATDQEVSRTAARLLAFFTAAARRRYTESLRDDDPRQRATAVRVLAATRAVPELSRVAEDPDRDVRAAVADGLARLEPSVLGEAFAESIALLGRLLTDRDHVVRLAAMDAAVALGMPDPLAERCTGTITHENWLVRKRAAAALESADPRIAITPLTAAAADPIVDVRRAAIRSLRRWSGSGRSDVATALDDALGDPDPGVRTEARWALA